MPEITKNLLNFVKVILKILVVLFFFRTRCIVQTERLAHFLTETLMHSYDENALEYTTVICGYKSLKTPFYHGHLDPSKSNIRFIVPNWVTTPKGILVGSAIFAHIFPKLNNGYPCLSKNCPFPWELWARVYLIMIARAHLTHDPKLQLDRLRWIIELDL